MTREISSSARERGSSAVPVRHRHRVQLPRHRKGRRAAPAGLAVPLFRLAVALEAGAFPPLSAWPYAWLAASLWATERDRAAVIALLSEAAARYLGAGDAFWRTARKYAEFHDVADDPAFAAAAAMPA